MGIIFLKQQFIADIIQDNIILKMSIKLLWMNGHFMMDQKILLS